MATKMWMNKVMKYASMLTKYRQAKTLSVLKIGERNPILKLQRSTLNNVIEFIRYMKIQVYSYAVKNGEKSQF